MSPKEPDQLKKVAVWLTLQSLLLPGRPHVTDEHASRIMQLWQHVGRSHSDRW